MPKYKCLKHNQVMEEMVVNNKIQPYCLECRKESLFDEELNIYLENEERFVKEDNRILRSEYTNNIVESFGFSFKILLYLLVPLFWSGVILNNYVSSTTLILIYIGFVVSLSGVLIIRAVLSFPKHSTPYSKPTLESIERKIDFEKVRHTEEVKSFIVRLQREYLIRSTRIEEIDQMSGFEFEDYIAELLQKGGFNSVKVTKKTGDGGVDILANNLQGERTAIQCKRVNSKVGFGAIQEIFMGKKKNRCKKGMVITNSYFTKPAYDAVKGENIELWNRDHLIEEMRRIEPQLSWEEYLNSFYVLPEGKKRIS
ncbi:hypothetical protein CN481_00230 [Bacillus sp. AFS006103]|nr:hypothetical protein CN481_00230 [Bacillus sp. AFS006103]